MSPPLIIKNKLRSKIWVWISVATATSLAFCVSSFSVWSSPSIPKLSDQGYSVVQTTDMITYFTIGNVVGPISSYILLSRAGRKTSLILLSLMNFVSSTLLFAISVPELLYISRFVSGMCYSILGILGPLHISESYHPKERQMAGGLYSLFFALGQFMEYVVAPFISYYLNNILITLVSILCLALFPPIVDESPVVMLKRGDETRARGVLESLWSIHELDIKMRIDGEIDNIKISLAEDDRYTTLETLSALVTNTYYRKSTLLVILVLCGFSLTGISTILMYIEPIIIDAKTPYSSSFCSAIVGIAMVLSGLMSSFTINRVGAKRTILICSVGNIFSLISLGLYFFLKDISFTMNRIYWLPVASLVSLSVFAMHGGVMLPYVLRGELLSTRIQPIASPLTDLLTNIMIFLTNLMYTCMLKHQFIPFWIFASFGVIITILVYIFLPETNNLTKSEIQELLQID